jgi:ERCC4-type nuclease
VFVDRRIGSADLADPLEAMGLPVERDENGALPELAYGDIAFTGKGNDDALVSVGIELKKLPDLISSLRTGRLSGHQLPGLLAAYDYTFLLVEGTWRPDAKGRIAVPRRYTQWSTLPGMPVSEMEKRLLTLDLMGGLRIRHTGSRACTLHFIANLYRWFTDKSMDRHNTHLVPHTAHGFLPLSDFRQTVMKFPHIGLAASKSVEEYFSANLREACLASVADWAEIVVYDKKGFKRLGMTVALAITQFIRGQKP